MKEQLIMHQAKKEDIRLIEGMLRDTAKWLKSIGSKQWNGILEGKDHHNTSEAIERGEVFYCTLNGEPVGMFILWEKQSEWDSQLWGDSLSEDFFYLHRLNLVRQYSGKGLAIEILEQIKLYGKEQHKHGIRLDCIANNNTLNHLYSKAGFHLRQTIYNHDAGEQVADFNLYEYLYL